MNEELRKDLDIIKYHLNEFEEEDRLRIEQWSNHSAARRVTFLFYQKIINAISHLKYYKRHNLQKAWKRQLLQKRD